ncbi:MAG TPA: hypothetical protein DDY13_11045, partial [Cytophagales bacterium]|nr:hypothetical protein [Cytophagales bacterium]
MKQHIILSWDKLLIAITGIVISACYPYPSETDYLDDYDITVTSYDESRDFSQYQTYALPDSIPFIDGTEKDEDDVEKILEEEDPEYAADVRAEIQRQMSKYGYTEVDENVEEPDVVLNIVVLIATNRGVISSPCWWYGGGGYWGWYPGWG